LTCQPPFLLHNSIPGLATSIVRPFSVRSMASPDISNLSLEDIEAKISALMLLRTQKRTEAEAEASKKSKKDRKKEKKVDVKVPKVLHPHNQQKFFFFDN
jgi:hypothetical protein